MDLGDLEDFTVHDEHRIGDESTTGRRNSFRDFADHHYLKLQQFHVKNSMGGGPRVMIRGHRAEKIASGKGTVWQSLKELPR